ncbi:MAG: PQQ-binding-like beta-propeller repeat protein [Terriglobia bacterium]
MFGGKGAPELAHHGGTYKAWRYSSPLDQINKGNLKSFVPVWSFQTGVVDGGFQATPLVADGVMYVTSSWNRIFAIEADTGRELWHYFYPYPKDFHRTALNCGAASDTAWFSWAPMTTVWWLNAKTGKEV